MAALTIGPRMFILAYILILPGSEAIPGTYMSLEGAINKRLPYPIATYATKEQETCERFCFKNKDCDAYSISEFEQTCYLHKMIKGIKPVHHLGYRVYIRMLRQEEGFYIHGTDYIRIIFKTMNFIDANRYCKKEFNGQLVTVVNQGLNDMLKRLMSDHVVFRVFIGLTDQESEGVWKYLDGRDAKDVFSNFDYNGQWSRRDKNCAYISNSGMWYHENCKNPHQSFCQIPMF